MMAVCSLSPTLPLSTCVARHLVAEEEVRVALYPQAPQQDQPPPPRWLAKAQAVPEQEHTEAEQPQPEPSSDGARDPERTSAAASDQPSQDSANPELDAITAALNGLSVPTEPPAKQESDQDSEAAAREPASTSTRTSPTAPAASQQQPRTEERGSQEPATDSLERRFQQVFGSEKSSATGGGKQSVEDDLASRLEALTGRKVTTAKQQFDSSSWTAPAFDESKSEDELADLLLKEAQDQLLLEGVAPDSMENGDETAKAASGNSSSGHQSEKDSIDGDSDQSDEEQRESSPTSPSTLSSTSASRDLDLAARSLLKSTRQSL